MVSATRTSNMLLSIALFVKSYSNVNFFISNRLINPNSGVLNLKHFLFGTISKWFRCQCNIIFFSILFLTIEKCFQKTHNPQYVLDEPPIKSDQARQLRYFFILINVHEDWFV